MMNLKPTMYAISLLSVLVACGPETDVEQTTQSQQTAQSAQTAQSTQAAQSAQTGSAQRATSDTPAQSTTEYVAVLLPTEGSSVSGTVLFTDTEAGIRVVANIEGLAAMTTHGFHIHEFGDCSATDANSAGGHFNPDNRPHGAPDSQRRHVGDLGNLISNGAGMAQTDMVDAELSFTGVNSIVGRSVIIHADADDLKTQPTGNAGARLACGVIEVED